MRALRLLAALLLFVIPAGCGAFCFGICEKPPAATGLPANTGFTVRYDSGSIPPPFNYGYTLTGTDHDGALDIHYLLTYQFRDQLTGPLPDGYSDHDDLDWSGQVVGDELAAWARLIDQTTLGPIPPLAPGSSSFDLTLHVGGGPDKNGVPFDRTDWEARIAAIDQRARAETHNPRSQP